MAKIRLQSDNEEALDQVNHLNNEIISENSKEGMKGNTKYHWIIPLSFFKPQYQMAAEAYRALETDPEDDRVKKAAEQIAMLKKIIDQKLESCHFPTAWRIPAAESYLETKQQIDRIMKCNQASIYKILDIEQEASDEERLRAWTKLACCIHPDFAWHKDAQAAFESRYCLSLLTLSLWYLLSVDRASESG